MKCLILGGGAEKGIAYIGILKFLEKKNLLNSIECYYGVSVGSIFATLFTIGYKHNELKYCAKKLDISQLFNLNNLDIHNIFEYYGFISPDMLIKLIVLLLEKKSKISNITFEQHYEKYQKKLVIVGSCLSDFKSYYFSVDNYPKMQIIDAIKISIAIPGIFRPIQFENKYFVDGSLFDCYPVHQANKSYPISEIFGVLNMIDKPDTVEISDIMSYLTAYFKSTEVKVDHFLDTFYEPFTIYVRFEKYYLDIESLDIDRTIDNGYKAAIDYYNSHIHRFKMTNIKINGISPKDIKINYVS